MALHVAEISPESRKVFESLREPGYTTDFNYYTKFMYAEFYFRKMPEFSTYEEQLSSIIHKPISSHASCAKAMHFVPAGYVHPFKKHESYVEPPAEGEPEKTKPDTQSVNDPIIAFNTKYNEAMCSELTLVYLPIEPIMENIPYADFVTESTKREKDARRIRIREIEPGVYRVKAVYALQFRFINLPPQEICNRFCAFYNEVFKKIPYVFNSNVVQSV